MTQIQVDDVGDVDEELIRYALDPINQRRHST